jgi:hypothetical protein
MAIGESEGAELRLRRALRRASRDIVGPEATEMIAEPDGQGARDDVF